MQKSSRWIGLPLVLVLALPVFAADDKKDKKKKGDDADPKEAKKEKLEYGQTFVATVASVSGNSQKEFTVKISYTYRELNQQAYLSYQQQLAQRQLQVQIARTPQQRQQALIQLAQLQQPRNLVNVKTVNKDVELRAADEVKVRSLNPPIDYDDKGNVKKYTKKELAELKGPDKTLPGYTAEFESLAPNQVVKIYLAKEKAAPKKPMKIKPKKGKKEKKADADDDDSLDDESKPMAVMIEILREAKMDRER
jgi:hypothetical protein